MTRILGIDPGLTHTGWGLIESAGSRLVHIADGAISTKADTPLAERLAFIYRGLGALLREFGLLALHRGTVALILLAHAQFASENLRL